MKSEKNSGRKSSLGNSRSVFSLPKNKQKTKLKEASAGTKKRQWDAPQKEKQPVKDKQQTGKQKEKQLQGEKQLQKEKQLQGEKQLQKEKQSQKDKQHKKDKLHTDRLTGDSLRKHPKPRYSSVNDWLADQPSVSDSARPDLPAAAEPLPLSGRPAFQPAAQRSSGKRGKNASPLKIIPLGGLEQIGMNITVFEYEDSIVIVDCGLSFPEDDMLGIDLVIPDATYLRENLSKVKGFVITHGHEDHIGALPYILREINVPIYSTKLTLALIEKKLEEHSMVSSVKMKEVRHGQVINLGAFSVEFIKTNHSIQDASALAIYSPAGIVVHTGDFKVDYTPVFGDAIDLQRLAEIGKKGVLALMCDSTNAERPGFTMSERTVGRVFDNLFNEYKTSRIIIATFASNVDRVQQIINTAYRFDRKVAVEGRSMVNVITTAADLGYLRIPDQTLIDIDQVKNYPDDKVVLITTGRQGESMAALSRMAASIHKKITIKPNDAIIFSSHPIPGNEKAVSRVINELSMKGARVIFQDAHVSGHACQEEIKLIYSLVRPRYAIPVHGEYRHLTAQRHLVEDLGMPRENIFVLKSGDVLELTGESAVVSGTVQTGAILVDGLGVGDVGNVVLKDRQHLAEDGIIIVVVTLERHTNSVLSGPDIVSRGFVYVREAEDLMEKARRVVCDSLDDSLSHNISDWGRIKTAMRDALSEYVWKETKRSPMILPIIMEA